MAGGSFPDVRPRRLRRTPQVRQMLQRVRLRASDLIVPVFVHDGPKLEVASMPGVFRLGVDDAADWLDSMAELGIGGYLVVGVLGDDQKDAVGSSGEAGDNVVCRLLRETQRRGNPMLAITDVCLCE
ncbi:MAG: porphobilinogen synthase, partial [Planctomycetota bacterium]